MKQMISSSTVNRQIDRLHLDWRTLGLFLFVVDGRVHDDGVDVSRRSSERRPRRVATAAARCATAATAVAIAILGARSEETLHSAGRHRRSFSQVNHVGGLVMMKPQLHEVHCSNGSLKRKSLDHRD